MTTGVEPHETKARAQRLVEAILPLIAAEIAFKPAKRDTRDQETMRACRKVGAAIDRLEQAKFTQGEIPARKKLERAARSLRAVLEKHHARK